MNDFARTPLRASSGFARLFARTCATAFVAAIVASSAGGCSVAGIPANVPATLPSDARTADIVLIGEVHDNAAQHRMRLAWLDELTRDRRFAIALEQFDAEHQPELDRALSADALRSSYGDTLSTRARNVAEAARFDFRGWEWDLYRPVIELALRRRLPLVAANLSPRETARIAKGNAPAAPTPVGWSAADGRALRESIREGHCDLLPEEALGAMADAQRSRDARIAQAIADARRTTGLPVVLLAGNGHVRRDIGVPRHLMSLRPTDRVVSIALLEDSGDAPPDGFDHGFDHVVRTKAHARKDPCEALRARLRPSVS